MIHLPNHHVVRTPSTRSKVPILVDAQKRIRELAPTSALFSPPLREALDAWSAAMDLLEATSDDLAALRRRVTASQRALRDARGESQAAGAQYARVVAAACHGDPAAVASLGLRAQTRAPRGLRPIGAPTGLVVEATGQAGTVLVHWARTSRAQGYVLEYALDPASDASWKAHPGPVRRRMMLRGLVVGARVLFRVAARSGGARSPFGEPVGITVR